MNTHPFDPPARQPGATFRELSLAQAGGLSAEAAPQRDIPTIQPALTPEEWADRAFEEDDDGGDAVIVDAQGAPPIVTVTPLTPVKEGEGHYGVGLGSRQRLDIRNAHALAALCLYGQPFGFTREDVAFLRFIAEDGWKKAQTQDGRMLLSLADRIAALLPPEAP